MSFTCLIVVTTIVCSQMIPELAHLIDCTTIGPKNKKTGILGDKPNYNIYYDLMCYIHVQMRSCVIFQSGPQSSYT